MSPEQLAEPVANTTAAPLPEGPASRGKRLLEALSNQTVVGVLIVLVALFGIFGQGFFSLAAWLATASQVPEILLLALGETIVIITAGIDLSVGATLGFAAMTSALVMAHFVNAGASDTAVIAIGLAVALLVGLFWGSLNGLLVARLRVTPFIATLATLGMATGGVFIISGGTTVTNLPAELGTFANTNLFGVLPWNFIVALTVTILTGLFLARSRFGLRCYAIGSSRRAAVVAGINLRRQLFWVYALTGVLAGLDGLLLVSRFVSATPFYGANDELNAIAAVIIGGASLFGGRGTVFGSFLGTLIVAIIPTGLIVTGVSAYWQMVGVGAVIIFAVFLDQLRHKQGLR